MKNNNNVNSNNKEFTLTPQFNVKIYDIDSIRHAFDIINIKRWNTFNLSSGELSHLIKSNIHFLNEYCKQEKEKASNSVAFEIAKAKGYLVTTVSKQLSNCLLTVAEKYTRNLIKNCSEEKVYLQEVVDTLNSDLNDFANHYELSVHYFCKIMHNDDTSSIKVTAFDTVTGNCLLSDTVLSYNFDTSGKVIYNDIPCLTYIKNLEYMVNILENIEQLHRDNPIPFGDCDINDILHDLIELLDI